MLTESQKKILENTIYHIIKESIFETNAVTSNNSSDKVAKRDSVMKWLDSDQSNHAALAYTLWNKENADESEQGEARSLFSKKFRGHDDEGKAYHFDDDEINTLYNMKDRFIHSVD